MLNNIAIIGSSWALSHAFMTQIALSNPDAMIHAYISKEQHAEIQNVTTHTIDYISTSAIESAALLVSKDRPLGLVMVVTDFLHEGDSLSEKPLESLSTEKMHCQFAANYSALALLNVIFDLTTKNSSNLFDWDDQEIAT